MHNKQKSSPILPLVICVPRVVFLNVMKAARFTVLVKRLFPEAYRGTGIPGNTFSVYMLLIYYFDSLQSSLGINQRYGNGNNEDPVLVNSIVTSDKTCFGGNLITWANSSQELGCTLTVTWLWYIYRTL